MTEHEKPEKPEKHAKKEVFLFAGTLAKANIKSTGKQLSRL